VQLGTLAILVQGQQALMLAQRRQALMLVQRRQALMLVQRRQALMLVQLGALAILVRQRQQQKSVAIPVQVVESAHRWWDRSGCHWRDRSGRPLWDQ
jgi:hypothetical protein